MLNHFLNIKNILILFIFAGLLTLSPFIKGNNTVIDSLENKLSITNSKNDKVDIYNELGFLYRLSDISKAIEYTQIGLDLSIQNEYKAGEIQSYIVLGIIYKNIGSFEKATDFLMQGLKTAEDIDDQPKISSCLSNLGSIYQTQKNYVNALDFYKRSLKIEEDLGNLAQKSIRLYNIGAVYELTDSLEKAYTYYYNSLLIEEELNNPEGIYFALYGIAGVDTKRGDLESAFRNISRGLEISIQINDLAGISRCNLELGKLYKAQNKYDDAILAFNKTILYADSISYLSEIKDAYFELSSTYSLLKDYKNAYAYLNKHMYINDSINNLEINRKIVELSAKYELEKKESEILFLNKQQKLQSQKNKTEKRSRLFLILSFILAIALTLSNLSRIIQKARRFLFYSLIALSTLILVGFGLFYLGNYSNPDIWQKSLDIFLDVITYASLPIFVTVLIIERVILNQHLKTAKNLSERIKNLDKPTTSESVNLTADNDKDYFEINLSDLLFLEANDNYSAIYVAQSGSIKKHLLRSSLKRMDTQLEDYEFMVRCHKSYIVNIHNITKVSGNAQGYRLHFAETDIEIPVSRNFPKAIIQRIKSKT